MSLRTDVETILARDSQNQYVQKLQAMVDNSEIDLDATGVTVKIKHAAGCGCIQGGICNCDATITVEAPRKGTVD